VPSTSHAKCRSCGSVRHKFARLNVCENCWREVKPSIREEWKRIKERRALRRAVDAHFQGVQSTFNQEALFVTTPTAVATANGTHTDSLDDVWEQLRAGTPSPEEREEIIARVKAVGVPKEGTPERALYMRLFIRRSEHNEHRQQLIARLYRDSDVPVGEIMKGLAVDANEIARVRRKFDLGTREDMRPYAPSAHIGENEDLIVSGPWGNAVALFRDRDTGVMRPVWDTPEVIAEPEPEPVAETIAEPAPIPEPETEPVAAVPVEEQKRARGPNRYRPPLTEAEKQEIIRLFMDPTIPVHEIQTTYNLGNHALYRMLEDAGIKGGRKGLQHSNVDNAGHFRMIDGHQTWVPGDAVQQLHLGQAEVVVPAPEVRAQATQQLAVPEVVLNERAWAVHYIVTRVALVVGGSIDEALRHAREQLGNDIDVIRVERS